MKRRKNYGHDRVTDKSNESSDQLHELLNSCTSVGILEHDGSDSKDVAFKEAARKMSASENQISLTTISVTYRKKASKKENGGEIFKKKYFYLCFIDKDKIDDNQKKLLKNLSPRHLYNIDNSEIYYTSVLLKAVRERVTVEKYSLVNTFNSIDIFTNSDRNNNKEISIEEAAHSLHYSEKQVSYATIFVTEIIKKAKKKITKQKCFNLCFINKEKLNEDQKLLLEKLCSGNLQKIDGAQIYYTTALVKELHYKLKENNAA